MDRTIVIACLPWLGLLVVLGGIACLLVRWGGTRLDLGRLVHLHADQHGAAQSLAFVLTLPLFVMFMLFIVQVSQLMIAQMVVQYAAFAAARSASVWIPASVGSEAENCLGSGYQLDPAGQTAPICDNYNIAANAGPTSGGVVYQVNGTGTSILDGTKCGRILAAAAIACVPICPSRDAGLGSSSSPLLTSMQAAYHAVAPNGAGLIDQRLEHKLSWAAAATQIEIHFYHSNQEPPLQSYPQEDCVNHHSPHGGDPYAPQVFSGYTSSYTPNCPPNTAPFHPTIEFAASELGWQDEIKVKVTHQLCLLPGPGSLLARIAGTADTDPLAAKIQKAGKVYTYALQAEATMGIEGLKLAVQPYKYGM